MKYKKKKSGVEFITLVDWHRESMKNSEFRKEYKALKPKYDAIRTVLNAKLKK